MLWIGGPPASGKTTVATRLARRHGLRLYSADTRTWDHRDRAIRAGDAAARKWESLTPVERWEQSTPAEMLDMSLHRARGPMVLDDVRALPRSPLIIAEGSPLPAAAVASGTIDRARAVWLLPTADFQRARLDAAGTIAGHAAPLPRPARGDRARSARQRRCHPRGRRLDGRLRDDQRGRADVRRPVVAWPSSRDTYRAASVAPRDERRRHRADPRISRAPVGRRRPRDDRARLRLRVRPTLV